MRARITVLITLLLLCAPGAAWAKQGIERYQQLRPYEVAFSWGDSATFWIMVHQDASLGGLVGAALADTFTQFLQELMRQRGVQVSGVERVADRRDFVNKLQAEGRTLRLFAVLYKGNRLHVYGNIVPKDGGGKTSTILPYFEVHTAASYTGPADLSADMKSKFAPAVNARIDQILTELEAGTPVRTSSTEGKNAR